MLLFKWIWSFSPSARSFLNFLNGVCFIRPKLSLFSRPPILFLQGLRFLDHVSLLFVRSLFICFFQCSYPVILKKILTEPQVYHYSFSFFSGGFNSSFVDHIPFSSFQMLFHAGAPLNNPLLAIQLFRSAKDISEDSCFHSAFVILSSSFEILISF